MSWQPDLIIGNMRPWPDYVRVVRSGSDDKQLYEPDRGRCALPETAIDHGIIEHIGMTEWRKCSSCGKEVLAYPAHFCPNCGARRW